jgi:hypothetical protein
MYTPKSNLFTNKMDVELDKLGPAMMNWICGEVDSRNSRRSCRSHEHSATVLTTARYSASALERETVGCLLNDHEISDGPR